MPAWQRNDHHYLGHQHQDYDHLVRVQDHDCWWNHHKGVNNHRHYQQDKRRLNHHCASRQRIGYVLSKV